NGKMALSGAYDNSIKLWEVQTGRELRILGSKTPGVVHSVAFSPDGRFALSGGCESLGAEGGPGDGTCERGSLILWDASSWRKVKYLAHSDRVTSVAFSPDGSLVLFGGGEQKDNALRLWDLASWRELRRFVGHTDRVNSVAFSGDGRLLLTGSRDGTMRL